MGVFAGPDVSENGLVFALDAGNKKTFANSVINSTSWDLGSGGASGYGQNGNTNENERVLGTDPFSKSAIVWETRASGDGNADGGWNSDWYNIDNTKLYRFSVWVKRTSTSSGGTFYLGLYGNASGVRRTDTNAYQGNPYWECSGTSKFDKDVWYLVVGHCYPYNTSYTGQHPETGIYTVAGGATKVLSINACNIGTDVKWAGSDVTQTIHRCYHYYCADNTTRLQLFDPRIDAIDGTEPSISALLSGFTANRLSDLVGSNNGTFKNAPTYSSANGGSIVFDGSNDYISIPSQFDAQAPLIGYGSFTGADTNAFTLEIWIKTSQISGTNEYTAPHLIGRDNGDIYSNLTLYNGYVYFVHYNSAWLGNLKSTTMVANNVWHQVVYVNNTNETGTIYIDGISEVTGSSSISGANYFSPDYIGRGYSNRYFQGSISICKFYDRALSAAEIQQNFNATRSRFGV